MATRKTAARKTAVVSRRAPVPARSAAPLVQDIRNLIESARAHVAQTVNATLTVLYWRIGHRIGAELLKNERAPYGHEIVATLSRQLVEDYGRGFTFSALTRMVKFAGIFPDERIVATL